MNILYLQWWDGHWTAEEGKGFLGKEISFEFSEGSVWTESLHPLAVTLPSYTHVYGKERTLPLHCITSPLLISCHGTITFDCCQIFCSICEFDLLCKMTESVPCLCQPMKLQWTYGPVLRHRLVHRGFWVPIFLGCVLLTCNGALTSRILFLSITVLSCIREWKPLHGIVAHLVCSRIKYYSWSIQYSKTLNGNHHIARIS